MLRGVRILWEQLEVFLHYTTEIAFKSEGALLQNSLGSQQSKQKGEASKVPEDDRRANIAAT